MHFFDPDMEDIRSSRYSSNHVVPGKNRDHNFRMVSSGDISLSPPVPKSCKSCSYHDLCSQNLSLDHCIITTEKIANATWVSPSFQNQTGPNDVVCTTSAVPYLPYGITSPRKRTMFPTLPYLTLANVTATTYLKYIGAGLYLI